MKRNQDRKLLHTVTVYKTDRDITQVDAELPLEVQWFRKTAYECFDLGVAPDGTHSVNVYDRTDVNTVNTYVVGIRPVQELEDTLSIVKEEVQEIEPGGGFRVTRTYYRKLVKDSDTPNIFDITDNQSPTITTVYESEQAHMEDIK